uniref:Uncharacterized protein n=1 Tax=Globodera rostochiensis TaxID=31243 RepID=A0A914I8T2_GLORO
MAKKDLWHCFIYATNIGDVNFTPIPKNGGLTEEQQDWEKLSFWQRAERSEYFEREGKERWLRDFGPADFYTNEKLHNLDFHRCRESSFLDYSRWCPYLLFPQAPCPSPEPPLEPLYGRVMLKDLSLEELLSHVQTGSYFYPDTPTDEINEMVQNFKLNQNEGASDSVSKKPQPSSSNIDELAVANEVPIPMGFGGILRKNSVKGLKKTVRWAHLWSDDESATEETGDQWVEESVLQAMNAPLDNWDDFE